MFPLDASTHPFEAVEIVGIPGLFTTERVSRATVPPGLYLYEMQTGESDWTQPALLARLGQGPSTRSLSDDGYLFRCIAHRR